MQFELLSAWNHKICTMGYQDTEDTVNQDSLKTVPCILYRGATAMLRQSCCMKTVLLYESITSHAGRDQECSAAQA